MRLPQELTAEVLAEILENWRRRLRLGEDAKTYKIPRWVAGRAANDVLHAADAWTALFDAEWVDPQTGEIVADNDDENVPPPIGMPPLGSHDVEPPPTMPAATPNPPPPPQGKWEFVHCEKCASLQNYLVRGLCWHCQWYPDDPRSPQAQTGPPIPPWFTRGNSPPPLDCCLTPHPCVVPADADPGSNGHGRLGFVRA